MTTVYSKESCVPCRTLKYLLNKKGVEYIVKDVNEPEIMQELTEKWGFSSVPVTIVNDQPVAGPNIAEIMKKLAR